MAEKKYYWLKLKRDFFKRHDIQIIEAMPNGKEYVLFYLKVLVEAIDHEGRLRFSDTIPYNAEMLSTITNTNIDIVRAAMQVFRQLDLVEILSDETIYLKEIERLIGCETPEHIREQNRIRQQRYRDNQKLLETNKALHNDSVTQTHNGEIEKEIEIEIEKESKGKTPRFAPPSLEDVQEYIRERGSTIAAEPFMDFYQSKGWMVGKNKMKDWKAAVRTWINREQAETQKVDSFSRQY